MNFHARSAAGAGSLRPEKTLRFAGNCLALPDSAPASEARTSSPANDSGVRCPTPAGRASGQPAGANARHFMQVILRNFVQNYMNQHEFIQICSNPWPGYEGTCQRPLKKSDHQDVARIRDLHMDDTAPGRIAKHN